MTSILQNPLDRWQCISRWETTHNSAQTTEIITATAAFRWEKVNQHATPTGTWPSTIDTGNNGYNIPILFSILPGIPQVAVWSAMPQNVQWTWPQWPNTIANVPSGGNSGPSPSALEIKDWFPQLENHPTRNTKNLKFSDYGKRLAEQGFERITQLSHDFMTITELQGWLDIPPGTAVQIFEYAQEDVRHYQAAGGVLYN